MALPKGFSILPFNDEPDESVNTAAVLFREIKQIDAKIAPFFEEKKEASGFTASCDYANLSMNGYSNAEAPMFNTGDACHARARGDFQHLFFNRWANEEVKEWRKPFINWLVNESAMACIFLSKNPDMILKYGAIVDARVYKGLAFAAAICTRSLHEHANHACLWWPLVQGGVHPSVAYMVAMCHRYDTTQRRVFSSAVSHGGVDPIGWGELAAKRWLGLAPLYKDGKARYADATFCGDNGRLSVKESFYCPEATVVRSSYSTTTYWEKDLWLSWQIENWKENLRKLGIDADKLPTVFEQPIVKPLVINLNEPEEDM